MRMRIVSGGQTGVDRAALDVALEMGMECGGWCPAGRLAEDGVIDARYPLAETPSADPAQRTGWNVRDSDATLVITGDRPSPGTDLAREIAHRLGKPLHVCAAAPPADVDAFRHWLRVHGVRALNVAGPRESESPGIYLAARGLLVALFSDTSMMSPESEAYLRSLDAQPEVLKRIERLTGFLDDVVMVSPRDMFVDDSNHDRLRIVAFWEWGVATYSVSIRWSYPNVDENQIFILPLIGRVASVSFSDENKWNEKDFLKMTVSLLPDTGFYVRAQGDAREHLKHLFRTYVLPHLPSHSMQR